MARTTEAIEKVKRRSSPCGSALGRGCPGKLTARPSARPGRSGRAPRIHRHELLADSSATGGALTSHRVALGRGADGAVPHLHTSASELFYVLDGAFDLLVGDHVVTARAGNLLIVPPRTAHAFAAHSNETAEALVIATPGIERFDYFRHVVRRRAGTEPAEILLGLQDQFDTHFVDSAPWNQARGTAIPGTGDRHDH